jgi:hypothetical protein
MRQNRGRVIGGLFAAFLAASAATLGFGACADGADDCRNTATCPFPTYCAEAGDAADEVDGCNGYIEYTEKQDAKAD